MGPAQVRSEEVAREDEGEDGHAAHVSIYHAGVRAYDPARSSTTEANFQRSETFLAIATQYPTFMLSECVRQTAAGARGEVGWGQTTDFSHLHVPFAGGCAGKNRKGSNASDIEQPSLFSSAASIESTTTRGSTATTYVPDGKGTALEKLSPTTANSSQRAVPPNSEHMFILRQACCYNCHCACHEKTTDRPQRRSGRLKTQQIECTDPICLENKTVSDNCKQYSSLFRSALSRVTSTKAIRVRYDLKSFRMVPNGSNAVRYVNHGNLPKLRECIESGEATIWDTTLDGWSLLHVSRPVSRREEKGTLTSRLLVCCLS